MFYFPLPRCHSKLSFRAVHQVIPLGAKLSVTTLWMYNLDSGRGQRLIKSFCGAQYWSNNHQVSFYSHPFSLPTLAKQNSAATIKTTQILALKHNGVNSQLSHKRHQSDSLQVSTSATTLLAELAWLWCLWSRKTNWASCDVNCAGNISPTNDLCGLTTFSRSPELFPHEIFSLLCSWKSMGIQSWDN